MKEYYVYLLASKKDGVLYVGMTSDLLARTWQHREGMHDGFSKKYWTKRLVYYEIHQDVEQAIIREKQIKRWKREWKVNLIQQNNPAWEDLYESIL